MIKKLIEKKETVNAIIEFVFSPSFYAVYIPSLNVYAKVNLCKDKQNKTNGALFKGVDALEKKAKDDGLGLWAENEETDYDENDVDY